MFSLAKIKGHKIIFLIWLHENSSISIFARYKIILFLSCAICSGVFQEMLTLHL